MPVLLSDYQTEALRKMKNGCILCGKVGCGKSRTALAYYYLLCGGKLYPDRREAMKRPKDLYIITTAKKRDDMDWEEEFLPFLITGKVDSWNNIQKYKDVKGGFFIFDEQRVVGSGPWVDSFLKITKNNEWVLLSATPGDSWMDFIPVFIANGFFRNRTQFLREHAVYARFAQYPKVIGWRSEGLLMRLKRYILVPMNYESSALKQHTTYITDYDMDIYRKVVRMRWNVWTDSPIVNAGELCYCLRRAVNSDETRGNKILEILEWHPRAIIFYNYDYELQILKDLPYPPGTVIREWNGHRHEAVPNADSWVYLVQYTAGCEGWNCITTDTMIFYSQNYSYKVMVQASGRIDRRNTPYSKLYYYHLKSESPIDKAITQALKKKKKFNENDYERKIFNTPRNQGTGMGRQERSAVSAERSGA